jgi:pyruvate dehydrogenase E2 component (dihydrolipoamide acetyltransferase)
MPSIRHFSLPAHEVVGMPALSPTMEVGTIGKWLLKEGDSASPGDAIAEIETDKASMAFECTDDIVIAKFLVSEGAEVKVGDPIMVTVEEGDVSAFADFVAPASAPVPAPVAPVEAKTPAPTTTTTTTTATTTTTPSPTPVAAPTSNATPMSMDASTFATQHSVRIMHSNGSVGPLTNKLAVEQNEYVEKYGKQLHKPLPLPPKKK